MTRKHLSIFIKVYETMHVTQAAEQLHMTQPAVTRTVKELESHYGVRLFERLNNRIYPTQSAHVLYHKAVHILEAFADAENELQTLETGGNIRIGATVTLGNLFLPHLLTAFQRKNPSVNIRSTVANGDTVCEMLLHNALDLALVENDVHNSHLQTYALGADKLCLLCAPEHPFACRKSVRLEEVANARLLLREKGSTARTYIDSIFLADNLQAQPVFESTSTQALVRAVICGLGISILPEKMVAADLQSGKIVSVGIENCDLVRRHSIAVHRDKYLTAAMREWIAFAQSFAKEREQ